VKCGSNLSLEVHHIEGYEHNEPELLTTLCYLCHGIAPMGKGKFNQWLQFGESGIDVLQQRLIKNGLTTLTPDAILVFCSTLIELGYELRKSQLRRARERMRSDTGRCEGVKPFGSLPGEAEILELIVQKQKMRMKADKIASELNTNGHRSRSGKPWRASTIRKIVARVRRKKANQTRLL
jgi:hypothetical protein